MKKYEEMEVGGAYNNLLIERLVEIYWGPRYTLGWGYLTDDYDRMMQRLLPNYYT